MRALGQQCLCFFREGDCYCARFAPAWHLEWHVSEPQDARFGGVAECMNGDILRMTTQDAKRRIPVDRKRNSEPRGELIGVPAIFQQRDAPIWYRGDMQEAFQ